MSFVTFDIGGEFTHVGVSDDLATFGHIESFKTPANFTTGINKILSVIKNFTDNKPTAIAGGIRGLLTEDKSGIYNDAVLSGWAGKSVIAAIKQEYNVPVYLENDTAMAGLGEAVYGAGKDIEIVVYHSIGTGVGGVRVVNGTLDAASIGFEPGHQILDVDRTILGDTIDPTLENLVSATAVLDRFGTPPQDIPQDDVIWNELAEYLAQGLRNTILYWSPDVIVLGGAMVLGTPAIQVDAVRKYTVETLNGFTESPLITTGKLGNEAGLYGALAILKAHQ